jgi:hypothetical protein
MSVQDFRGRLETTKQEIVDVNTKMLALDQAKERAIEMGDGAAAVKSNRDAKALQERLEDLTITKAALEAKLRIYKINEAEALKISHVLADELYPQGLQHYERLRGLAAELKSTIEKITQVNEEMVRLANHHRQLIGDKLLNPQITIPVELYSVIDAKFDVAPPKTLDIRVTSQRESERLKEQFEQQRPAVSKILKKIKIDWPVCPKCGAELLAQRYAMAEDGSKGHASLRCSKHYDQWMEVSFPARPPPPGARYPIPSKDPLPLGDIAGSVLPTIQGHGLADQPGLTIEDENQGGKTE